MQMFFESALGVGLRILWAGLQGPGVTYHSRKCRDSSRESCTSASQVARLVEKTLKS